MYTKKWLHQDASRIGLELNCWPLNWHRIESWGAMRFPPLQLAILFQWRAKMSAVKWLSGINDIFFFFYHVVVCIISFHCLVWRICYPRITLNMFCHSKWWMIKKITQTTKNMTYVGVNWKCPFYYIIWVCSDIPWVIFLPWLSFIITDTSTLNERGREKRRERKSFITALWTNTQQAGRRPLLLH